METAGMGGLLAFAGPEAEIKIYTGKRWAKSVRMAQIFQCLGPGSPLRAIVLQKYEVRFLGAQQCSAVPERHRRKFRVSLSALRWLN